MTLPDCMMPDGAEPCKSWTELCVENERLTKERDELLKVSDFVLAPASNHAELERLRPENERLRAVLWWVTEYSDDPGVVRRVRDELKKIGQ